MLLLQLQLPLLDFLQQLLRSFYLRLIRWRSCRWLFCLGCALIRRGVVSGGVVRGRIGIGGVGGWRLASILFLGIRWCIGPCLSHQHHTHQRIGILRGSQQDVIEA